jgi:predicted RNA methylase
VRIDDDVLEVLRRARITGGRLTLPHQLERKIYVRVDRVLKAMGATWNRKMQAHLFEEHAADVIDDALATGVVVDHRREFNLFETPAPLARQLVELAGVQAGMKVLEPSAGPGRIVRALLDAGARVWCVEIEERTARPLLDELATEFVYVGDFLEWSKDPEEGLFDRIVANPPFSRSQDVEHVEAMWRLLAPGGRLVSVMSPGWTFHRTHRADLFRAFAYGHGCQWEMLPERSFRESGTDVNCGVMVIDKPAGGENG